MKSLPHLRTLSRFHQLGVIFVLFLLSGCNPQVLPPSAAPDPCLQLIEFHKADSIDYRRESYGGRMVFEIDSVEHVVNWQDGCASHFQDPLGKEHIEIILEMGEEESSDGKPSCGWGLIVKVDPELAFSGSSIDRSDTSSSLQFEIFSKDISATTADGFTFWTQFDTYDEMDSTVFLRSSGKIRDVSSKKILWIKEFALKAILDHQNSRLLKPLDSFCKPNSSSREQCKFLGSIPFQTTRVPTISNESTSSINEMISKRIDEFQYAKLVNGKACIQFIGYGDRLEENAETSGSSLSMAQIVRDVVLKFNPDLPRTSAVCIAVKSLDTNIDRNPSMPRIVEMFYSEIPIVDEK